MNHWPERCNQPLCDGHIAGIRRALDKDQENRVRPQIVGMVLVATPTWCQQYSELSCGIQVRADSKFSYSSAPFSNMVLQPR